PDKAKEVLHQGLEKIPDNIDLLWSLAELLALGEESKELSKVSEKLKRLGVAGPLLGALDATVLVQKGQWSSANARLGRIEPLLVHWPEMQFRADLYQALCCEKLGDSEGQLNAYRRAVLLRPSSEEASFGIGVALTALGKHDQAVEAYWKLL